jgi:hypothetical protein
VVVAPGSITALGPLDTTDYGSLLADTVSQIVKTGITLASTTFALTPPATPGQSIDYVIEAAFLESDATPVVLPYLNAANPAQAYSGPGNSGVAQNTQRIDRVQLQLKAGAAAGTGTQIPPAVDTGWVGLYIVTVDNGQTSVVAGDIVPHPACPLLIFKLPQLTPGFSRRVVFNSSGSFTVPVGVQTVRATVVGAGGGGGGTDGTYAAAGGRRRRGRLRLRHIRRDAQHSHRDHRRRGRHRRCRRRQRRCRRNIELRQPLQRHRRRWRRVSECCIHTGRKRR